MLGIGITGTTGARAEPVSVVVIDHDDGIVDPLERPMRGVRIGSMSDSR